MFDFSFKNKYKTDLGGAICIKKSAEYVILTFKHKTIERSIALKNALTLEEGLLGEKELIEFVNNAENLLKFQSAEPKEKKQEGQAFAQESVIINTEIHQKMDTEVLTLKGTQMLPNIDTLLFSRGLQKILSLAITKLKNIDLLWKNTLEDILNQMRMFTTKTGLETTTELKILNCGQNLNQQGKGCAT